MASTNATIKSLNMKVLSLQRQVTSANESRNTAFQKAAMFAVALTRAVSPTNGMLCCPFCEADLRQPNSHEEDCVVRSAYTLLEHHTERK